MPHAVTTIANGYSDEIRDSRENAAQFCLQSNPDTFKRQGNGTTSYCEDGMFFCLSQAPGRRSIRLPYDLPLCVFPEVIERF